MRVSESKLRNIIKKLVEQAENPTTEIQPIDSDIPPVQEFYLLGYWVNPYGRHDKEYFWGGPYESREEASYYGKRKQKYGQPKRFIDWMQGQNRIFNNLERFAIEARKVGINPLGPVANLINAIKKIKR